MSKGILLVNLGSPTSPSVPDVRRYLNEFLMDGRVIDVAWPLRRLLVGVILINRPKQSGHAYEKIWTKDGSPLVVTSKHLRAALEKRVTAPIELGMRYQNPSIESAVKSLAAKGVNDVLLIPLFPHYAMSSYETAVVRVRELAAEYAPQMKVTVQPPYYNTPDFIAALVASAADFLKQDYDHLLFSYHGIPERHLRKSDPTGCHCLKVENCCEVASPSHAVCYRAQCFATTAAFVKLAGVPKAKYSVSFQSRLGRDPWLKPYTDYELVRLAQEGKKKMLVICPAFVSDCLETIEEIGMRGCEDFLAASGKEFTRIPCMNEHPLWIAALENMANAFLQKP
ncbi:MAG: ferrochelatase [Verrucomicrobia subdivision 3 bacterium]|nr:ferrochelatase [Verrucomicrobiota bacterium]MCC6820926.1 ferrochelatase [Limisphaerales bacterium]